MYVCVCVCVRERERERNLQVFQLEHTINHKQETWFVDYKPRCTMDTFLPLPHLLSIFKHFTPHTMHTHTHTSHYAHAPHTAGVPFPRNFITIAKTILKRLFRVYAHIYHAHFDDIIQLQEEVGAIVLSVA